MRRRVERRESGPLNERGLNALVAPLLGVGQLALVDGRVRLEHLDAWLLGQRVLGEEVLETLPVANLPRALHEQCGLRIGHGLGELGEQLPLVEVLGASDEPLLPQPELGARRVDQLHIAALPAMHAIHVRSLRRVPCAVLLERERAARLVVRRALGPERRVQVAIVQLQGELAERLVPLLLRRVVQRLVLQHWPHEVPRAVRAREVLEDGCRQLGHRLTAREGMQPCLDRIRARRRLAMRRVLAQQRDDRLDEVLLLRGRELLPYLRQHAYPQVVHKRCRLVIEQQLGHRREQLTRRAVRRARAQKGALVREQTREGARRTARHGARALEGVQPERRQVQPGRGQPDGRA